MPHHRKGHNRLIRGWNKAKSVVRRTGNKVRTVTRKLDKMSGGALGEFARGATSALGSAAARKALTYAGYAALL